MGSNEELINQFNPDIEAKVYFLTTAEGGRNGPVGQRYCPAYKVKDDYLTSSMHHFIDQEFVAPGEAAHAYVKFITPEAYPGCLWIGKEIPVQEGSKVVGIAKVLHIFNRLLDNK